MVVESVYNNNNNNNQMLDLPIKIIIIIKVVDSQFNNYNKIFSKNSSK